MAHRPHAHHLGDDDDEIRITRDDHEAHRSHSRGKDQGHGDRGFRPASGTGHEPGASHGARSPQPLRGDRLSPAPGASRSPRSMSGSRSPRPGSRTGGRSPAARFREQNPEGERKGRTDKDWLRDLATWHMKQAKFRVDFNEAELDEVRVIEDTGVQAKAQEDYPALEPLPWVSIDNDDTRDIDQLTAAVQHPDGRVDLYVGIADVNAILPEQGAIYQRAAANTTSVYTPACVFTMLPEKLCFDITSLVQGEARKAVVFKITYEDLSAEHVLEERIFHATITNQAKLAYNSISDWLNGGDTPAPLQGREDLQEAIRLQDRLTAALLAIRRRNGTLEFDRPETLVFFDEHGSISAIRPSRGHTRAGQLIENVMIAANGAMSRFLEARGLPSVQRVLPKSDRWDQIVDLAAKHGHRLDASPSSASLRAFLAKARADLEQDVELFRDLCMSVIKLLGRGEYVALKPGSEPVGHFALAVTEYSHSTAPNRRFPDVIVHRMLSAALRDHACPYTLDELESLAQHCSEREAAASKLERATRKSAACILLQPHLDAHFTATVTGSSDKGVYARFEVAEVPAEGRVLHADEHAYRVGQKLEARLVALDVAEGFIDIEDLAHASSSTGRGSATPSGRREGSRNGAASRAHDGSPAGARSPGQQRHSSLAPGEGDTAEHRQRHTRSPRHQTLDD